MANVNPLVTSTGSHPSSAVAPRLHSLDALRGFDMLWIIGGAAIMRELARLNPSPTLQTISQQLEHVPWAGLHAYDLIFPLFMFLSGIAIPLSMDSRLERGDSKWRLWGKILSRTVLLVMLGFLYNGVFAVTPEVPRYASVLGQIGIAWAIAATLHLGVRSIRARIWVLIGWLAGIAMVQLLVPIPGSGAGVLTPTGAVNAWIDRMLLPGRLHGGSFDPEGLLCIVSAATLTISGSLVGSGLRHPQSRTWRFAALLGLLGALAVGIGSLTWWLGYPPIKALWTSTFDLLAIGISMLLFTAFFCIIDLAKLRFWSFPLQVIGMNSIAIYLGARLIPFLGISEMFFGRAARLRGDAENLCLLCGVLLLEWLVLFFFWRKRWFLKV